MALPHEHRAHLRMRSAHEVMDLPRLGSHHPFRLSFMRVLTRTMVRQRWQIACSRCELDDQGIGEVIYTIHTPDHVFTFVAFTRPPEPSLRPDHIIDQHACVSAVLCAGEIDAAHLELLRANVPGQKEGRLDSRSLVMTRAQQSTRNFEYVIDQLAHGEQPGTAVIARVGYLYRTTAVYSSGKFGMSDWSNVKHSFPDFAHPFAAEMFTCFLLRQVSFDVVEYIARQRSPNRAVTLTPAIKRYFGIGNTMGLGVARFIISHPLLINRWTECREVALARARSYGTVDAEHQGRLEQFLSQARQHLQESISTNDERNAINRQTISDLEMLLADSQRNTYSSWEPIIDCAQPLGLDAQEILHSCLIELYPDLVDDLADFMCVDEAYDIKPEQPLHVLKTWIESSYDWALAIDFKDPDSRRKFWYRAAEKTEPSVGELNVDKGYEKKMNIAIGQRVHECYDYICGHLELNPDDHVAHFLIHFPAMRSIVRRVQTMAPTRYGEIRANVLDANCIPTQLLGCILTFFGVERPDPQPHERVHTTMFQGAPIISDMGSPCRDSESEELVPGNACPVSGWKDNWSFSLMPAEQDARFE